jgi:UDP-N-acetylmuramyl tripeptide synthase
VRLLLAKNPASWLEALTLVADTEGPVVVAFNSEGVDGRDPSWLYDVDFSGLRGRRVTVTGRRATDMLVRLEMAGLTDLHEAPDLATALSSQPAPTVEVIANYTAFQDARKLLKPWPPSRP